MQTRGGRRARRAVWWWGPALLAAAAVSGCGDSETDGGGAPPVADGNVVPRWDALSATLLIPRGSAWRYRDDGSDQGTAWRTPAFSDTAWKMGPAQLGYGDGDEATVVSFGGNPSARFITTYFRRSFVVTD